MKKGISLNAPMGIRVVIEAMNTTGLDQMARYRFIAQRVAHAMIRKWVTIEELREMYPNPKTKTHRDNYFKDVWIRRQPCCACDNEPIENHLDVMLAHKGGGTASKGDDKEGVPLCFFCHQEEHRGYETFWRKVRRETGKSRWMHVKETWSRYRKECPDR